VLFERLVTAAREAGLIAKTAAQVVDSSHVLGQPGVTIRVIQAECGIR
jgi:hypothetical protein